MVVFFLKKICRQVTSLSYLKQLSEKCNEQLLLLKAKCTECTFYTAVNGVAYSNMYSRRLNSKPFEGFAIIYY